MKAKGKTRTPKFPWVRTVRRASGLVENVCVHGVGHPAIGSVMWMSRNGHAGCGIHGCDGCCRDPEWERKDALEGLRIATNLLYEAKKKKPGLPSPGNDWYEEFRS